MDAMPDNRRSGLVPTEDKFIQPVEVIVPFINRAVAVIVAAVVAPADLVERLRDAAAAGASGAGSAGSASPLP